VKYDRALPSGLGTGATPKGLDPPIETAPLTDAVSATVARTLSAARLRRSELGRRRRIEKGSLIESVGTNPA
jgi:hypothetical protein